MTTVEGGCLCGRVRYRVAGAPVRVTHCHCTLCRRSAEAPFLTWATFRAAAFAVTRGAPAAFRATAKASGPSAATAAPRSPSASSTARARST